MIESLRQVEGRAAYTAVDTQLMSAVRTRHSKVKQLAACVSQIIFRAAFAADTDNMWHYFEYCKPSAMASRTRNPLKT